MSKKIYFICYPLGPPEKAGYQHQIINLAEGLAAIGIPFYSNVNYWLEDTIKNDYLLRHHREIDYRNCDAIVFSSWLIHYNRMDLLPDDLFTSKRNYKIIFLDDSDGLITPGYDLQQKVDIVLKSHYNRKYKYPKNFIPWQFGLSNRIISAVSPEPFHDRQKTVLFNFRISHPVRELAKEKFLPLLAKHLEPDMGIDLLEENTSSADQLYWHQSGRRHYSSYYKKLSQSTACTCFGGYFQHAYSNRGDRFAHIVRKLDYRFHFLKPDRVYQFDSWRFWESLVAGTCTIHIDFEKYGALLPVMPINGKHYIGVDFDNISKLADVFNHETLFEEIGKNGREWVLQHYSPKQIAIRFLEILNALY